MIKSTFVFGEFGKILDNLRENYVIGFFRYFKANIETLYVLAAFVTGKRK